MGESDEIPLHDQIINALEKRLTSDGHHVFPKYEYELKTPHEADLIIIEKSCECAWAIEVKERDTKGNRKKAYSQLEHDREFLQEELGIQKIFLYYAHGDKRRKKKKSKLRNKRLSLYEISQYIPKPSS
ncbi:hypothetical protein HNV12_01175 [Methanococcoides sp. SA1]|nr:hypothetical protein [Methanococcoides sp. SA1]